MASSGRSVDLRMPDRRGPGSRWSRSPGLRPWRGGRLNSPAPPKKNRPSLGKAFLDFGAHAFLVRFQACALLRLELSRRLSTRVSKVEGFAPSRKSPVLCQWSTLEGQVPNLERCVFPSVPNLERCFLPQCHALEHTRPKFGTRVSQTWTLCLHLFHTCGRLARSMWLLQISEHMCSTFSALALSNLQV